MKRGIAIILMFVLLQACKKTTVQVVDFSKYTQVNNACEITTIADSNQWTNNVLNRNEDTATLYFNDNVYITDSVAAQVTVSASCPNPSNGLFIWQVNPTRQCKLKVACVNTSGDIVYYNSYGLGGGPITIGFDFRSLSGFKKNNNYRLYYGFYNSHDSLYFSGHGDISIQ